MNIQPRFTGAYMVRVNRHETTKTTRAEGHRQETKADLLAGLDEARQKVPGLDIQVDFAETTKTLKLTEHPEERVGGNGDPEVETAFILTNSTPNAFAVTRFFSGTCDALGDIELEKCLAARNIMLNKLA